MRGEHGRDRPAGRSTCGEGVGVDDHRDPVGERRGERVARAVAAARADHPGLHPPGADTTSGCAARTRSATASLADVAHHPGQPARGAGDAEHRRRRGTAREPARTPTTPRVYLCASRAGRGSSAATSAACSASTAGAGSVEPDVDEVDRAAGRGGRVDQVGDLVGAEGDRDVGPHVRPVELAGVDVDARGYVDRDDRDARDEPPARAAASGRRPAGRRCRRSRRPPRRAACRPSDGVDAPARRRPAAPPARPRGPARSSSTASTAHAAPGQQRAGVQRVAAVVAGPDQQQHPGAVRRRRASRATASPARPRPAASARPRAARSSRLGGPDLLDGVRAPHAPPSGRTGVGVASAQPGHELSSTTTRRGDPGVVGQRQVDRCDPEHVGTAPAPVPRIVKQRAAGGLARPPPRRARPARPARRAPWPAPPWRRTGRPARPAAGPPRPAVNSRSRSAGRPVQRLLEALDVDDVDADPHDHGLVLLDRDGLGEVARLVDVVAHARVASSQANSCSGTTATSGCSSAGTRGSGISTSAYGAIGVVALLGQHDRAGAAGADLLDAADHLVVQLVAAPGRHDAEHRQPVLDQRDRAVLELAGGEALGVDVGELLELQRALERHRVAGVAARGTAPTGRRRARGRARRPARRRRAPAGCAPASPRARRRSRRSRRRTSCPAPARGRARAGSRRPAGS